MAAPMASRAYRHGTLAIAGTCAALLTGCAGPSDSGSGSDSAAPSVELVTPKTLAGGRYALEKDTAALEKEGTSVQAGMPANTKSVLARYRRADDPADDAGLAFSGAYGEIGEPSRVQNDMFDSFVASASGKVVQERRQFRPSGQSGPVIDCEVVRMPQKPHPFYVSVCTWAEASDAALVVDIDKKRTSAAEADMEAFAEVTAGIRKDTRRPS